METTTVAPFLMIGLAVRTTNAHGQAMKDIPQLWQEFMSQQIADKIPSKTDPAIYSLYTDYEGDHTQPYTTLIGCKVDTLDVIPEGLTGKSFEGGNYTVFTAHGKIEEHSVIKTWLEIWAANLPRTFKADFEVYDDKVNEEGVKIFVGVK